MKARKILTALLLALVLASVAFLLAKESRQRSEAPNPPTQPLPASTPPASATEPDQAALPPAHQVVAYYFHGTARCPSCLKIEAYTQEAIQSGFAEELKSGTLTWQVVNVEEPGNQHFAQDYQLYTKSVILSDRHHGREARWKNLDQVWTLFTVKADFQKYIQDEVRAYLVEDL